MHTVDRCLTRFSHIIIYTNFFFFQFLAETAGGCLLSHTNTHTYTHPPALNATLLRWRTQSVHYRLLWIKFIHSNKLFVLLFISPARTRARPDVCVCVRFPLIFLFVCLLLPHDKRSRSLFNLLYLKITKNEWKKEQISRTIAKQIPFNWRRATSDERERERKKKENRVIVRISYLALVDM